MLKLTLSSGNLDSKFTQRVNQMTALWLAFTMLTSSVYGLSKLDLGRRLSPGGKQETPCVSFYNDMADFITTGEKECGETILVSIRVSIQDHKVLETR